MGCDTLQYSRNLQTFLGPLQTFVTFYKTIQMCGKTAEQIRPDQTQKQERHCGQFHLKRPGNNRQFRVVFLSPKASFRLSYLQQSCGNTCEKEQIPLETSDR